MSDALKPGQRFRDEWSEHKDWLRGVVGKADAPWLVSKMLNAADAIIANAAAELDRRAPREDGALATRIEAVGQAIYADAWERAKSGEAPLDGRDAGEAQILAEIALRAATALSGAPQEGK